MCGCLDTRIHALLTIAFDNGLNYYLISDLILDKATWIYTRCMIYNATPRERKF